MSTYYVVIGGPQPGIVKTWPEARRRTHQQKGAYTKKFDDLNAASAYYEEVMGEPVPPLYDLYDEVPRPQPEAQEDTLVRVKNPNGVLERRTPTPEQIDGLRSLGLWP